MRRSMLIPVVMTAIVLNAALPRMAAADDLTGVLVDSACYTALGSRATAADHAKCAITCAQKGGRLALVTAKGAVYMVIGVFTQDNNAKLIPLLNQPVVLSGTVAVRVPYSQLPPPTLTSDSRRPSGSQDGVVTTKVRKGDFREGDVPDTSETTIEIVSIKLATVGIL